MRTEGHVWSHEPRNGKKVGKIITLKEPKRRLLNERRWPEMLKLEV
jgi:hypothetical protein